MAADHFCLRWNNYQSNMVSELDILRTEEYLVDVTLCCEGHKFRAHKVILSACSPYFRNVFKENPCEHPVVILKDVLPEDVEALLSFVYQGVVYVSEKKLSSFLQTAELLQIKGLAGAASTFNDEQTKLAASQQTPIKRRKSAPVRIVKQEDGEENSSNTMEGEDEAGQNDYSEDMDDIKNEDEEGSMGEDSELESTTDGGGGGGGAVYPGSMEIRDESSNERDPITGSMGGRGEPVVNLLQQTLARQRAIPPQPSMDTSLHGQYAIPVTNQNLPEILSPAGGDRNGRRPCPLCTKVISNKSNLLKHMRIRHSDQYNPACCVLCNKVFKNKYSLRAHLNIYHKEYISSPVSTQPQPPPPQPQQLMESIPQYLPSV